ncbi:MAG: dTMP kinase [Rhodospirillaceae bacterium]|nr:dTMP kinase [Rhodospirillaceae bacterium]MDD9916790.1 dTMP kinase [Rhodospirillaceae bacterium]
MPGRFVTFEGGEGGGKSTNLRMLATALEAVGETVIVTREPGGSEGAEQVRRLLVEGATDRWDSVSEALLHYAARRDHVERLISPALDRGDWVVCDRFADSTMAYQGYGHGLGREPIETLHGLAIGGLKPDLTLILDLPVETGLTRAGSRGGDETRYERMADGFHQRLRDGFLDIAAREPDRCVVIDATQEIDAVQQEVRRAVTDRLGVGFP